MLERLSKPITHRDIHEIVYDLEHLHEQVPIGRCHCGATGQETTSADLAHLASRHDLGEVADDLSYRFISLRLDGRLIWSGGP